MTRYSYRPGRSVKGRTAAEVHVELQRIKEKSPAGLTPRAVVDHARPETAILHPAFEWRDKIAAAAYRDWQARHVITAVVTIEDSLAAPQHTAWVNIRPGNSSSSTPGVYVEAVEAAADPEMAASVIAAMLRAIADLQQHLAEFRQLIGDRGDPRAQIVALVAQALQAARSGLERLH